MGIELVSGVAASAVFAAAAIGRLRAYCQLAPETTSATTATTSDASAMAEL